MITFPERKGGGETVSLLQSPREDLAGKAADGIEEAVLGSSSSAVGGGRRE